MEDFAAEKRACAASAMLLCEKENMSESELRKVILSPGGAR